MRILALDYGKKHTGLALSDQLEITSRPLKTIHHQNDSQLLQSLSFVLQQYKIKLILIGLPKHKDGHPSPMTQAVKEISSAIETKFKIATVFVDEQYTSQIIQEQNPHTDKDHQHSLVANLLLKEYLLDPTRSKQN